MLTSANNAGLSTHPAKPAAKLVPVQSFQAPRATIWRLCFEQTYHSRPIIAQENTHGVHHRFRAAEDFVSRPSNGIPEGGLQVEVLKPIFGSAMISPARGTGLAVAASAAAPLFRHDELLQYGPIMSRGGDHRRELARRRAWLGSCHPQRYDARRVSRTRCWPAARKEMFDAIEKGHADYYSGVNWWVMYTLLGLPTGCRDLAGN